MGISMNYRLIFLMLFSFFLVDLSAQEAENDSLGTPVTIDGKAFYLHPIVKGNTLYSISKKYGIAINDLKMANQQIWNEMRIGDTLKIPLKAIEMLQEDQEQSDGNFLIHEVRKKNTLYSIAREYNLEIPEIIAANPEVEEEGLKKGMKLKIPVAKIKSDPQLDEYLEPAESSPYLTHRVMPKETLYSLSKVYDVSIDSILSVNNGLPEGLMVDQLINLPILKQYRDTIQDFARFDSMAFKDTYNVSLLLPFYLDEIQLAEDTTPRISQKLYQKLYSKSQYAIDFYQGFKLAADSLVKAGLRLELNVYDTGKDIKKVKKLLNDSALLGTDLIVGPLYYEEFVLVADYAKRNQINIVSPVKQSNKVLLGNSYVSKVISSDPVLLRFLGAYIADSVSNSNLLLVYPDHIKERSQAEMIKKSYLKNFDPKLDSTASPFLKELMWDPKQDKLFVDKLDSSKNNVIIVPSDDQPFVTQLITGLNMQKDFEITLIGLEDWMKFDNIEVDYLHKLNVHLVTTSLFDYHSKAVKSFCREYQKHYEMPADQFAILGFDVGMYYLNLINEYGLNFEVMYLGYQDEFLSRKFEFFKTGIESGYENHSVYLVKYEDYQVNKVY